MSIRIRKSVWSLAPDDPAIVWYRKAVEALLKHPSTNPSSWRYLAAVHGIPSGMAVPSAAKPFWDKCQHQSWFFLSWHRGYVASFEAVVAKTIEDLGGPAEWALPYWDYSESLTKNPKARLMPPSFFDRSHQGKPNALWSRRANAKNGDFNLDATVVTLAALNLSNFTNSVAGKPSGFGGPKTGMTPPGSDNGALENLPHNRVHNRIGGQTGFMADPSTAALDPIFWLHHCNIDRLWEVWRNQSTAHKNPTEVAWLSAIGFQMHDGNGHPFKYSSKDMLDTTKVLHGYRYDSVPVATEPAVVAIQEVSMTTPKAPELAGASEGPISLDADETHVVVKMQASHATAAPEAAPSHAYLSLENVTASGVHGDVKVYLVVPDHAPVLAGILTTFGIDRATQPAGTHGGSGLNQVFDVTEIASQLGFSQTHIGAFTVMFEREGLAPTDDDDVPEGLSDYVEHLRAKPSPIKVGSVRLFYE